MICIGLFVAFVVNGCKRRNTQKNMILSENVIFRGLRLSLGHLANKSLKALCLSSKIVYQHFFYLLGPNLANLHSRKFFSHTVVPEGLLWKLSFQTTFFASCRFTHNPLSTMSFRTTFVLQIVIPDELQKLTFRTSYL